MNQTTTKAEGLSAELAAHKDQTGSYLLLTVEADGTYGASDDEPAVDAAVVIDRSGSMGGPKIEMVVESSSKLIASLRQKDRITVVAFDHEVDVLASQEQPSALLADRIARLFARGNTNLYGGWVKAAKLVKAGGRVILLSDGQANNGRYTDAEHLSVHAGISYERYKVTTSTIGVGDDYDEALMAGMARRGGGNHYYAKTVESILEAFSQERFSLASEKFSFVSVKYEGKVSQIGHLWGGEKKRVLIPVTGLSAPAATLRFTDKQTGETKTIELAMPSEFGLFHRAGLERLLSLASVLHQEALKVRDENSARMLKARIKDLCIDLLSHPLSDEPAAKAALLGLERSAEQLESLSLQFDQSVAVMFHKRSMERDHNVRERAKAFSSSPEEMASVSMLLDDSEVEVEVSVDPKALAIAPISKWKEWVMVPVKLEADRLIAATTKPKDMLRYANLELEIGVRIRPIFKYYDADELLAVLRQYEKQHPPEA